MKNLMLCVDEDHWDVITDQDGQRAAATYGDDRETRRLLAERLVLCWEACRGLTNEQIAQLRAENERMRSALEAGEKALQEAAADMVGYCGKDPEALAEPLRRAADARMAMRSALVTPNAQGKPPAESGSA